MKLKYVSRAKIIAFLPTINSDKSYQFCSNILGLKLESEDDFALVFKGENISLRITIVPKLIPQIILNSNNSSNTI